MPTRVYITAAGDDLIRIYTIDDSGRLTHQQDVTVAGGPSPLTTSRDGQILYCSLRESQELAAFRFQPDGGLGQLGAQPIEGNSCYIATDKTGRYLLAAYYGAGKVTVHRLAEDGTVGQEICSVPTAEHAHFIETDASNRYAFVPHTAPPNCIYQFLFDEHSGQLSPNPHTPRLDAGDGEGPRHFVFSLDERFVYTSNENGSSVTAYRLDKETGTLSPFQTLSTLPDDFHGENTCAQIHLHPSGRALYITNRGHDSVAVFRVDTASGELTALGQTPTEPVPRVFNVDPTGRWLLAAGQASGKVAAYAIHTNDDAQFGTLTPLDVYEVGERPMWVHFQQSSA